MTQASGSSMTLQGDWVPCAPPGGASGGPGEDVPQPQRIRVMVAHSTDGRVFQRPTSDSGRLLLDQADVPDAVVLPSGRILVYFNTECRDRTPFGGTKDESDVIGVAVSDAKGAPGTWVYKDVTFDNALHGLGQPADPNPVLWKPQENLLRLFVTEIPLGHFPTCYSYKSTDGFTFTYEGKRYDPGAPMGMFDPENFRFSDSNWQIITGPGYALSTDDGSTFTQQSPFSSHVTNDPSYHGVPLDIAVTNTAGVYRIFAGNGQGTGAIESLKSTASPWTSWEKEGTVLEVGSGMESCELPFPHGGEARGRRLADVLRDDHPELRVRGRRSSVPLQPTDVRTDLHGLHDLARLGERHGLRRL